MPGKVIKVNVSEGQEVRKNQSLLIVEAMKMENDIKAGAEGVVRKIHVQPGELVDSVKTLIELEPKA
jgi:biotin carboxyl carrier protein